MLILFWIALVLFCFLSVWVAVTHFVTHPNCLHYLCEGNPCTNARLARERGMLHLAAECDCSECNEVLGRKDF